MPSTSKRSGLAARFAAACTLVATPSRIATTPQHSFGCSPRAWSITDASSSVEIRISAEPIGVPPPARRASGLVRLGLEDRLLLVGLAAVVAVQRLLELAHPLA